MTLPSRNLYKYILFLPSLLKKNKYYIMELKPLIGKELIKKHSATLNEFEFPSTDEFHLTVLRKPAKMNKETTQGP